MSEAATPDRAQELLAELAELDMALARKVHAAAMAAEDPEAVAGLARTYQRVARSVRQTLALKAKLAAGGDRPDGRARSAAVAATLRGALARRTRYEALGEAVERVVYDEAERYDAAPAALAVWIDQRLSEVSDILSDCADDDANFAAHDLDTQVRLVCEALGLPAETAARWRALPARREPPGAANTG